MNMCLWKKPALISDQNWSFQYLVDITGEDFYFHNSDKSSFPNWMNFSCLYNEIISRPPHGLTKNGEYAVWLLSPTEFKKMLEARDILNDIEFKKLNELVGFKFEKC